MRRLKPSVIRQIQEDTELFLDLCKKSCLKQSAIGKQLAANSDKLTRYDLLDVISKKLDTPIEDLVTDI